MNIGNQKTTHKFTYSTLTRMKWKAIEPHQGDFITEDADNMIAWAHSNNITVRGKLVIIFHFLFHLMLRPFFIVV